MRWTALLAVAVFVLAVGSATAAPTPSGEPSWRNARTAPVVLATGSKRPAVTVHVARRPVRLGDRVSVVGKRLADVSRTLQRTRIRAVVVKRLAHALRVASGHSVLTIHTGRSRARLSPPRHVRRATIGEFEIEFEHGDLVEDGFTPVSPSGTVEIEGHLVSVSPLVVSVDGLPIEITVPSGLTLPALTPGRRSSSTVQTGAGNTFTLVSIESAANNEDEGRSRRKAP